MDTDKILAKVEEEYREAKLLECIEIIKKYG